MNTVQYVDQVKRVRITKTMATPKKGHTLDQWLKAACKVVPEIPNPFVADAVARIEYKEAFREYVRFDLRYKNGHRTYVVILRNNLQGVG